MAFSGDQGSGLMLSVGFKIIWVFSHTKCMDYWFEGESQGTKMSNTTDL